MILVINSGSSSLKFKLFDSKLKPVASGLLERVGQKDSFLDWKAGKDARHSDWPSGIADHQRALNEVFKALQASGFERSDIAACGHRVVHGGEDFTEPTVVTAKVEVRLAGYSRLAPLHNPANLAGIVACRRLLPKAKQVACFDTAFYRTLPDFAYTYALPYELYEKQRIRKYGFHGISHDYVSREAARILKKPRAQLRLITCHLGSGASVTAVKLGKAVDTTMGFTPLQGLVMSSRCGDIDPAIPLFLMRELQMSEREVDELMNRQSGLLGLTGHKDLRDILVSAGVRVPGHVFRGRLTAKAKRQAKLAINVFCYNAARYIGSYAALMGGVDAVVFTAGVGERSEPIRKRVMALVDLPWNPKVMVVPTDEELMIAQKTAKAIKK